jgi:hypothetical protein
MRLTLFFLFSLLSSSLAFSQKLIKEMEIKNFHWAGLHPSGELYIAADDAIKHYNANGDLLNELKISLNEINSLDSWHLTQFVLYQPSTRQIKTYNPQLEERSFFYIDSVFAMDPQKIAGSYDQKSFWIVDAADNSLKKVNAKIGEVTIDVPLAEIKSKDILFIREYQQFLFIVGAQNVHIHNGMGKKIKSIAKSPNQTIEFYGEEIFVLNEAEISLTDLFTNEKRKITLPVKFNSVLIAEDRLVGFTQNKVSIYNFKLPE